MASNLLTKEEIGAELCRLDPSTSYAVGDDCATRMDTMAVVRWSTNDQTLPMAQFSPRILQPLTRAIKPNVVEQITSARGSIYGPFFHNAIVAQGLKAVMRNIPDPDNEGLHWHNLPADVREGLDLIALKISRIVTGDPEYLDNWDDIAGYATIVVKRIRAKQGQK